MTYEHKTWMASVVFALCVDAALAVPLPETSAADSGMADASPLMAFYGVPLATSPIGGEDKTVWMAKVQGLIAQAPLWVRQNVLAAKTREEFAANLAILEAIQRARADCRQCAKATTWERWHGE